MPDELNGSKLQVIIPYETLVDLLKAAERNSQIEKSFVRLEKQMHLLRGQFLELMERFRELKS